MRLVHQRILKISNLAGWVKLKMNLKSFMLLKRGSKHIFSGKHISSGLGRDIACQYSFHVIKRGVSMQMVLASSFGRNMSHVGYFLDTGTDDVRSCDTVFTFKTTS